MKILVYRPDGAISECNNIIGFVHLEGGIIQITHHNEEGKQESIRTSLPYAIIAESNAEIAEFDRSYGQPEKGD